MSLQLTTVAAPELTANEDALLRAAIDDWSNRNFDDNKKQQTKAIFQRVFENDAELEGFAFTDFLMMTPQNDLTRRYCAVVRESGLEWIDMTVPYAEFQDSVPSHLVFSEFLTFESDMAALYEYSSSEEEEEDEYYNDSFSGGMGSYPTRGG